MGNEARRTSKEAAITSKTCKEGETHRKPKERKKKINADKSDNTIGRNNLKWQAMMAYMYSAFKNPSPSNDKLTQRLSKCLPEAYPNG